MNYIGGKHRQGPIIAKFVKKVLKPNQLYVEPFCGAMGVAYRVNHSRMLLSDVSTALMNMWSYVLSDDCELPDVITEEMYNEVKAVRDPDDWRTAYYGFGMAFGATYMRGYAREGKGPEHAVNYNCSRRLKKSTLLKRDSILGKCDLHCGSYTTLNIELNSVVYCDPPYFGRMKGYDCGYFDHEKFWDWVRELVIAGNIVLVTEFTVPPDFIVLHSWGDTVNNKHGVGKSAKVNEVLVCHESQKQLWGAE